MPWMIEARGLTKHYPASTGWRDIFAPPRSGPLAVDGVTLQVRRGELFGLVGPNGAGKTTLIKLLTTLIEPSAGEIRIAGHDIRAEVAVKQAIGLATSDERSFYWRLSGRQNLRFFARLHNIPGERALQRIEAVLGQVGLLEVGDKRFHTYSTGMRQRLAIARALLTEPQVVFLDEPTKGLDPLAAQQVHKLIRGHLVGDLGITVFLTSHHLKEVEALCDRIAVMHKGRIQACGSMPELRRLLGPIENYTVEVQGLEEGAAAAIAARDPAIAVGRAADRLTSFKFANDQAEERLAGLIQTVQHAQGRIRAVYCAPISLDTIFEHLTRTAGAAPPRAAAAQESAAPGKPEPAPDPAPDPPANPAPSRRRGPWGARARIAGAVLVRDMLSETSYRFSFSMQVVEIFLTVTALFFLGRMISQDSLNQYLAPYGGNYFAFSIIGIAFYGYFNVGFSNFAEQLREAQTTGTLEAMLTTPAGLSTIVMASSLWKFIMTTLRVVVILLSGAVLLGGGMRVTNLPLVLVILLLTVASASSFGIIAANIIIVVKRGDPISWLFKSASWLVGGILFPVSVLPAWMQYLSLLLPTTHALRAMRLVILKDRGFFDVWPELLALSLFSFLLLPVSLRALRYAVRRAKREGTLTHY